MAEGIEHEAQADMLKDLGCDAFQGYFFSPPIHETEAGQYVHRYRVE